MAAKPSSVVTLPVALAGESPASPYPRARFDRGNLYAETARALRRAQVGAVLLAGLSLLLAGGLLHLSSESRIIPYVVEVDRHGAAVAFGPAEALAEPDRRVLLHTLGLWVRSCRTVTPDREVQRQLVDRAYSLSGGPAVARLNEAWRAQPPFERAGRETVSVQEVESILAAAGPDHWRLQWREEIRDPGGRLRHEELWQALVRVEVRAPSTVEEVLANPLGIRVTEFDWQRLESRRPGEAERR